MLTDRRTDLTAFTSGGLVLYLVPGIWSGALLARALDEVLQTAKLLVDVAMTDGRSLGLFEGSHPFLDCWDPSLVQMCVRRSCSCYLLLLIDYMHMAGMRLLQAYFAARSCTAGALINVLYAFMPLACRVHSQPLERCIVPRVLCSRS